MPATSRSNPTAASLALAFALLAAACARDPIVPPLTCPLGQAGCGETCIDVTADPKNCGGCGIPCATGQVCAAGSTGSAGSIGSGSGGSAVDPTGTAGTGGKPTGPGGSSVDPTGTGGSSVDPVGTGGSSVTGTGGATGAGGSAPGTGGGGGCACDVGNGSGSFGLPAALLIFGMVAGVGLRRPRTRRSQ